VVDRVIAAIERHGGPSRDRDRSSDIAMQELAIRGARNAVEASETIEIRRTTRLNVSASRLTMFATR
jgi:hypothetical protein